MICQKSTDNIFWLNENLVGIRQHTKKAFKNKGNHVCWINIINCKDSVGYKLDLEIGLDLKGFELRDLADLELQTYYRNTYTSKYNKC